MLTKCKYRQERRVSQWKRRAFIRKSLHDAACQESFPIRPVLLCDVTVITSKTRPGAAIFRIRACLQACRPKPRERTGFSHCSMAIQPVAPTPRTLRLALGRFSLLPRHGASGPSCNLTALPNCSYASSTTIARRENFGCTISWSCQTTFICCSPSEVK